MRVKGLLLLLLAAVFVLTLGGCSAAQLKDFDQASINEWVLESDYVRARVTEIISDETNVDEYGTYTYKTRVIMFEAEALGGKYKGLRVPCRQTIDSQIGYQALPVEPGDAVFLYPSIDESGYPIGDFGEYDRTFPIYALLGLFCLLVLVVGRVKGLRSLIGLAITCAVIFAVFLPLVIRGYNPVWLSVVLCSFVTLATLLIVSGFNYKTVAATIGCVCGVVSAGLITTVFQLVMKTTGLLDENSIMLAGSLPGIDMGALIFASVIIGAVGATMDVSISIASSLEELSRETEMSRVQLAASGMKIGRDIMGTMTNTLILAYVGQSMHLLVLLLANSAQMRFVVSWELIATEILRALSGSIGLILVVPATSVVGAWLYGRHKRPPQTSEPDEPEP